MHQYLLIYHVNIVLSIIQCIGIRTEDKQNGKAKLMTNNFENSILKKQMKEFFSDQMQSEMQIASKINIIDRKQFPSLLFQHFYARNAINGLSKLSTKSSLISLHFLLL